MALLPAEALDLGNGHPLDIDARQRLFHVVQLVGLDNALDQFHG